MIIRRRLNLFPLIFEFKQYKIRWHRIGYCCGLTFYEPRFLLLLKFIFKDKIYFRCPQCGKVHSVKLSYHLETHFDKKMREENRMLEEFRNG